MSAPRAQRPPSRTAARPATPVTVIMTVLVLVAALALASCSEGDEGAATTTTRPPVSAGPPTTAPLAGTDPEDQPPEPVWVVQIGSSADDSLHGVAGRGEEVVAVGWTEGALDGPGTASRDPLVARVGTDAEVLSLDQRGTAVTESAAAVGSGGDTTLACGLLATTDGDAGAATRGDDAWCAPVDAEGNLGEPRTQGSTDDDRLDGAAVMGDGSFGYAAGTTMGLFPAASDTTAGILGQGDALVWQLDTSGAAAWVRQFGTGAPDSATGVAATDEGDAVVVGSTEGQLKSATYGGRDGYMARFERSGLPRWITQFGTSGTDEALAVALGGEATRGTEAYVAAGRTDGELAPAVGGEQSIEDAPRLDGQEPVPTNAGGDDAIVAAFDSSGDAVWEAQLGSTGDESASAVAIDGSTVLVAGTTTGVLDTAGTPAAGGGDGFLAALDLETGRVRWITQFGTTGEEVVQSITTTEDGLVVVAGSTTGELGDTPAAGGTDGFLIAFPLPSAGGSAASSL